MVLEKKKVFQKDTLKCNCMKTFKSIVKTNNYINMFN